MKKLMQYYRGNSIMHWANKAEAYGKCIMDLWEIVDVYNSEARGKHDIRDVVKELLEKNRRAK